MARLGRPSGFGGQVGKAGALKATKSLYPLRNQDTNNPFSLTGLTADAG
jgi:hypothetical protein